MLSPGYQSLSFGSLVHTQMRFFKPLKFTMRSYITWYNFLHAAAPFAPHQNHPPAASCKGRQMTGTFCVCSSFSIPETKSMSLSIAIYSAEAVSFIFETSKVVPFGFEGFFV